MIFVYREAMSDSARLLAEALECVRSRRPPQTHPGDAVVSWGQAYDAPTGVRVLNGSTIRSKFTDAVVLKEAGVATIEVSRERPVARPATAPIDPAAGLFQNAKEVAAEFLAIRRFSREAAINDKVGELQRSLYQLADALAVPAPAALPAVEVSGEWLPRTNDHVGGTDFDGPVSSPDFWVKKEAFVREFRVHSFMGRSIRAGVKRFNLEGQPTGIAAWVRSEKNGWGISYDGVSVKQKHRDIAHAAVRALGLDFGAVDIGERADGSLVVLEVNRAPGLEGGTVDRYADAITKWLNG